MKMNNTSEMNDEKSVENVDNTLEMGNTTNMNNTMNNADDNAQSIEINTGAKKRKTALIVIGAVLCLSAVAVSAVLSNNSLTDEEKIIRAGTRGKSVTYSAGYETGFTDGYKNHGFRKNKYHGFKKETTGVIDTTEEITDNTGEITDNTEEITDNTEEITDNTEEITEEPREIMEKKPIIYIYPEEKTEVKVDLALKNGEFTCVYPTNKNMTGNSIEWNVTAYPDGTLRDKDTGLELYSLYWEGESKREEKGDSFSTGYCIAGQDTVTFLNTTLRKLGLSAKEAEEFIIYWLPKMQNNKYNLISFDTEQYIENNELSITPTPDNLIRVFMTYKPVDTFIDIPEQDLGEIPSRDGYTVVEWGGAEIE